MPAKWYEMGRIIMPCHFFLLFYGSGNAQDTTGKNSHAVELSEVVVTAYANYREKLVALINQQKTLEIDTVLVFDVELNRADNSLVSIGQISFKVIPEIEESYQVYQFASYLDTSGLTKEELGLLREIYLYFDINQSFFSKANSLHFRYLPKGHGIVNQLADGDFWIFNVYGDDRTLRSGNLSGKIIYSFRFDRLNVLLDYSLYYDKHEYYKSLDMYYTCGKGLTYPEVIKICTKKNPRINVVLRLTETTMKENGHEVKEWKGKKYSSLATIFFGLR